MTLIAHVSDTHLDGTSGSLRRVERVVEHLAGLHRPVDAVLLTGDIADHGHADEYATAAGAFRRLDLPLLWLPGNHDVRDTFAAAGLSAPDHNAQPGPPIGPPHCEGPQGPPPGDEPLTQSRRDGPLTQPRRDGPPISQRRDEPLTSPRHDEPPATTAGDAPIGRPRHDTPSRPPGDDASSWPLNRTERVGVALFALCDSTIPGRADGRLDDATLEWLDAVLDGSGPAFVCFHHPPVEIGHPFADRVRQFGEERLAAVLARHPQVVAILCGHFHTATITTFAGRPLVIAPGVASTLIMPWERDGGDLDRDAPPGLAFHDYRDGRLTTHFRTVQGIFGPGGSSR
jgi:predicted phosphodiesterase